MARRGMKKKKGKVGRGRRRWRRLLERIKPLAKMIPIVGETVFEMVGADRTFARIRDVYDAVDELRPLTRRIKAAGKRAADRSLPDSEVVISLTAGDVRGVEAVLDGIAELRRK